MIAPMNQPLLRVEKLRKHFAFTKGILFSRTLGHVKAVDDVSFDIKAGETLGLVGESGCGKTTTSRMILNLEEPTEGRILLEDEPIQGLQGEALRAYRAKVQAVFQDPWSSLNPRMKVGRTIAESLIVNGWGDQAKIAARVRELLLQVGLRPEQAEQYPHEFSGGQRQRVALAAALASRPKLIVLDEPVSALDVSIRAQMMNLLKDIQAQDNVAYLLVAHDLATVRHMADHTVVMYLGKIVEKAPTESLFDDVRHPYTKALFSAVLVAWPGRQRRGDRAERRGAVAAQSAVRLPLPHALPLRHAALLAAGAGPARGLAAATPWRAICSTRLSARCRSRSRRMSQPHGPLQGVKVVSCSTAQAGTVPYMLMADLGADVIKIEAPDGGDGSRRMTVLPGMPSTFFETNNRGVKSVTLNLKSPEGRAILHKLVAKADIFGQNFRPGAAEKNGFGWEELRKINPKLVYVSISGYGTQAVPTAICPAPIRWRRRWAASPRPIPRRARRCAPASPRWPTRSDRHAGLRRRARGAHPCAHHRRRPEDRAVAAGRADPPDGLDLHHHDVARQESGDRPGAHHRHGASGRASAPRSTTATASRWSSSSPARRTGRTP